MPSWADLIREKLRRLWEQEAQPLPPVMAPPPPEPPPAPPAPPAPMPLPPTSPPVVLPPPPLWRIVERDAAFVEAAYRSYIGKAGRDRRLLFNYQNARVATDKRDGMLRHPLDAVYNLPVTGEDLRQLVAWARAKDERPWKAEGYDCDDRAFHLKAMLSYYLEVNIGIVLEYNAAHIFNIAVTADGKAWVVEPEDAKVYSMEEKPYPLLTGVILH